MAIKSLDTEQQISIQALIRSWKGKLTWDALVTSIQNNLSITVTRQTLDKYLNIKNEYKKRKQSLKGQPVSSSNTEMTSFLQKDIDLAEKVLLLEAELKVVKDENGYLQAFISKFTIIGQSNPNVLAILQKTLLDIESTMK